jgi:hypothetical protein
MEMNPEVSREKIVREIRRGTLPTKAAKYSTGSADEFDHFLSPDALRPGNVHVAIDFEAGSAVITFSNYAMGHPPYAIHKASGLVVSKRHLYSIWSNEERPPEKLKVRAPHRPKGTGKQQTDAKLVKRMHKLLIGGLANNRTDAVRKILEQDKTLHGQSQEGTIKRLNSRYAKHYGRKDNRE